MKKIFLAGHNGMVGSAIYRKLKSYQNIILITQERKELDLTIQTEVMNFFASAKPDEVILAAARVGGIHANYSYPADFIYENLQIQNNVIHASHENSVDKLLFLGSSCIYPRLANQPICEEELLAGPLETTNEPYAIAKIAGIKLCESYRRQYGHDYRSVMPTNLYGPGDNYHPENSHVIAGLIRRFHSAKISNQDQVTVWGTGTPQREFLFVDDMACKSLFLHDLKKSNWENLTFNTGNFLNVGSGEEISIASLAKLIKKVVGFKGELIFDNSKPDGTPRKILNNSRLQSLNKQATIPLIDGLLETYNAFKLSLATENSK